MTKGAKMVNTFLKEPLAAPSQILPKYKSEVKPKPFQCQQIVWSDLVLPKSVDAFLYPYCLKHSLLG